MGRNECSGYFFVCQEKNRNGRKSFRDGNLPRYILGDTVKNIYFRQDIDVNILMRYLW